MQRLRLLRCSSSLRVVSAFPHIHIMADDWSLDAVQPVERDYVKCSICLGPFKQPLQLECRHKFCEGCLRTAQDAWENEHAAGDTLPCPICRKPVESPKPDFATDEFVKNLVLTTCACGWVGRGFVKLQAHMDAECPLKAMRDKIENLEAELVATRSDLADALAAANKWQTQGLQQHEMFSDSLFTAMKDLDAKDKTIEDLRRLLREARQGWHHDRRARRHSRSPRRPAHNNNNNNNHNPPRWR